MARQPSDVGFSALTASERLSPSPHKANIYLAQERTTCDPNTATTGCRTSRSIRFGLEPPCDRVAKQLHLDISGYAHRNDTHEAEEFEDSAIRR